jgi:hypothetical protein
VVQNHNLIINKHTFENSGHHIKKSLKILKHLYTNIFYHVSLQCIDINWTRDDFQFSVDNPCIVLSTVAEIDTLSIENCQVKIRSLYFYIIFICKWISFSSLCKIVRSSVILLLPEYVLTICHGNDKLPNINQPINQYWISLITITNFLIHFNVTKCREKGGGCGDKQLVSYLQ